MTQPAVAAVQAHDGLSFLQLRMAARHSRGGSQQRLNGSTLICNVERKAALLDQGPIRYRQGTRWTYGAVGKVKRYN